jgi:hypothetical protein
MDITPLYELTELERLYIGIYDPVPPEQIEEMQRRAPQCKIVTDIEDPVDGGWRYVAYDALGGGIADPRYALLREQMLYDIPRWEDRQQNSPTRLEGDRER